MVAVAAHEHVGEWDVVLLQPADGALAVLLGTAGGDDDVVALRQRLHPGDGGGDGSIAIHALEEGLPVFPAPAANVMQAMADVGERAVNINQDDRFSRFLVHCSLRRRHGVRENSRRDAFLRVPLPPWFLYI